MTDHPDELTPEIEARFTELFSHLETPEIPVELQDDSFLASVYDRALAAESASLGPVLDASITPVPVPDGEWDAVAWADVGESEGVGDQVATAMPADPGPAPGVLWTRIRADIQEQRADRRRAQKSRWMRLAAAGILISAGLVGFFIYGTSYFNPDGTPQTDQFVFREDPSLGSSDLFQVLGR